MVRLLEQHTHTHAARCEPAWWHILGASYFATQRFEDAKECFLSALHLSPDDMQLRVNTAVALQEAR